VLSGATLMTDRGRACPPTSARSSWGKLHAALESRVPELVRAWVDQIGSLATVAPFVIGGGMATLQFIIDAAETYPLVETRTPADGRGEAMIVREPVGVAVALVP
jgi:aldehyde dehydrogenase (NAD+)